ncbi:MAG: hypothetical protein ABL884_02490 [Methyloglobulus sp.]
MKKLYIVLMLLMMAGCTTTGHFKVPEGSNLYIYKRPEPVTIKPDGEVTTKPYFWTAAGVPPGGGVPYRLEKMAKPLKKVNYEQNSALYPYFGRPSH